jgi:hypothetical protein
VTGGNFDETITSLDDLFQGVSDRTRRVTA